MKNISLKHFVCCLVFFSFPMHSLLRAQVIDSILPKRNWTRIQKLGHPSRGWLDSFKLRDPMTLLRSQVIGTPLPPDEVLNYVKKESLRYKMTLHPAYRNVDSLLRTDSVWRRHFEINPLLPLAPWLAGYRYEPEFWVRRMLSRINNEPGGYYIQNMYIVNKRERFIRQSNVATPVSQIDTNRQLMDLFTLRERYEIIPYMMSRYDYEAGVSVYPDTLYYELSAQFFPFEDRQFTVLYCEKTGDRRIVGGNVFIEPIPCSWKAWLDIRAPYYRSDEMNSIYDVALIKTTHAFIDEVRIWYDADRIFGMRPLYQPRGGGFAPSTHYALTSFYFGAVPQFVFLPLDCEDQSVTLVKFSIYKHLTDLEKKAAGMQGVNTDFEAYQVKYTFDPAPPVTYEATFPRIRGLTEADIKILKGADFDRLIIGTEAWWKGGKYKH